MFWPVAVALTVAGPSVALTATADKLGASSYSDREAAARLLLSAGERAVGPLTAAGQSPDPEVRRRAAELLDRITDRRAWTATEVNVQADGRPLNDVLAGLATAGGVSIRYGLIAPPVTVHLERVPFWRALDAVCAAAELVPEPYDGRGMHLHSWPPPPHVCYTGPFRLTVTAASGGWVSDLSGRRDADPPRERVQLNVSLAAEPKAPVLAVGRSTIAAAEDDRGRSMRPAEDRTSYYRSFLHRSHSHTFTIDLTRPDKATATVRTLRGTVAVTVLTGTFTDVVVTDPLSAGGQTTRGRTTELTVEKATVADDRLTLSVALARRSGDTTGDLSTDLEQRLTVADAAGTVWQFDGTSHRSGAPHRTTTTLQFRCPAGAGRPATLTLAGWQSATRDVPFEFKDIPLP